MDNKTQIFEEQGLSKVRKAFETSGFPGVSAPKMTQADEKLYNKMATAFDGLEF